MKWGAMDSKTRRCITRIVSVTKNGDKDDVTKTSGVATGRLGEFFAENPAALRYGSASSRPGVPRGGGRRSRRLACRGPRTARASV